MALSRRTPALEDLGHNALSRGVATRRGRGLELLDLTESNPTVAGCVHPEAATVLAQPGSERYAPSPGGAPATRQAIADCHQQLTGWAPDVDDVLVTASTSEAYAFLVKLLCDPGDVVLTPSPSYPLLDAIIALEGARQVSYPLRHDGRWHVDLDALAGLAAAGARALVVVNPNNPTGHFVDPPTLSALLRLCAAHDLALISDEVFAPFPLDRGHDASLETAAWPLARHPASVPIFSLNGLSKLAGLPQMKLGWIVLGGAVEGRDEVRARLEFIADAYLSVGTAVQLAAPRLARADNPVRGLIQARLLHNLALLRRCRGPDAAWDALPVEGGWYAVLRVPAVLSDEAWAHLLLERDGVLVYPGRFFGFAEGAAHLVISLLTPSERFVRGLTLLAARVEATLRG